MGKQVEAVAATVCANQGDFVEGTKKVNARSVDLRVVTRGENVFLEAYANRARDSGAILVKYERSFPVPPSLDLLPETIFDGELHDGQSKDAEEKAASAARKLERKLAKSSPKISVNFL